MFADGVFFEGFSKGYNNHGEGACGEVVFNTAMTGYQEIITDPSYHSQIINFTHPHIGNTGINRLDDEAETIFAGGIIARKISDFYSNWRATCSLPDFLRERKIAAIDGVDTRAITHHLRKKGALAGCIMPVEDGADVEEARKRALARARAFTGLENALLARQAGQRACAAWNLGAWQKASDDYRQHSAGDDAPHIVVIDCGCKNNILRCLTARGCRVSITGYDTTADALLALQPDGVMVSNGPGDPAPCAHIQTLAREVIARKIPLFGLCLGHQIIAGALDAGTRKMKFGHHGANHPVRAADGTVMITSQNHGFEVAADTLPPHVRPSHTSLFDGSLQGFRCDDPPLMTFQGHPEASPGPADAGVLFDDFIEMIRNART